jgi:hypothetical protein
LSRCCPDPIAEELDMSIDEVVANHGFDPRNTPLDTMMAHEPMGLAVAHAMEHGDEPYEQ